MLFKLTGQAFILPASIMALGFFILYAASRMDNRLENKGIKLYGFFTVALLSMTAAFLILGGIFDKELPEMPGSLELPPPSGDSEEPSLGPELGPESRRGMPSGDEEMSLDPNEGTLENESLHRRLSVTASRGTTLHEI